MITLILLLLLPVIIVWLLIAPMRLVFDTETNTYGIIWYGLARAQIIGIPGDIVVRVKSFFWKKDFYPLHASGQKQIDPPKDKRPSKIKWSRYIKKGIRVLKSCSIQKFRLNIDTDDYILNSYLYPLFCFLSTRKTPLQINYKGDVELTIILENRLWRILKAIV